MVLRTNSTGSR